MPLAEGPAMYFGGSIETFALPIGAFIVISTTLFYLFRAKHTGPRLKYLATASVTAIITREPGPVPAPPVSAPEPAAEPEPEPAAEAEPEAEPETTTSEPEPET